MSRRTSNDPRGRSTSPLARPRGPLPGRVYWFRRVLVLGLAAVLVVAITRLLSYGGGGSDDGKAEIVRSEASQSPTLSSPTASLPPTPARPGRKGRLVQPSGPCDPTDVLVTPIVREAHVAEPVRIVLAVTSMTSPACTFQVAPRAVILRLLSPERSEPLWTSQHCTASVPERTVVARPSKPGRVPVLWNGRTSDDDCSNLTEWVFPGTYTAEAIAVGSSRATSTEFVLGLPIRPTVTRTPKPKPSPSASGSATSEPSAGRSSSPSAGAAPPASAKPSTKPSGKPPRTADGSPAPSPSSR